MLGWADFYRWACNYAAGGMPILGWANFCRWAYN